MSQVKVHVGSALTPEQVQRIREVSPRLEVSFLPNHDWLHGSGPHTPPPERAQYLKEAEVLLDVLAFFQMDEAPRLRWLQVPGAGVEKLRGMPIMSSDVIITNARIFATPISEYIFASLLAYCRAIPRSVEVVQRGRYWPKNVWTEFLGDELYGKTIAILGYGSVGERTAHIAKGFGMNIIATRRSIRAPVTEDGVRIYPSAQMDEVLKQADFVVLSLPLTRETEGIIGEKELRMMKPSAYIVNVGRGKLIQRDALEKALTEGWIGGAGLDVHDPTPPSPDYPFYDSQNVIMTPHMAGVTKQYYDRVTDLFCENLNHYLAGEPLRYVIDKQAGY
jgi:phosphoglycerate dehydrogenase-like enzyme